MIALIAIALWIRWFNCLPSCWQIRAIISISNFLIFFYSSIASPFHLWFLPNSKINSYMNWIEMSSKSGSRSWRWFGEPFAYFFFCFVCRLCCKLHMKKNNGIFLWFNPGAYKKKRSMYITNTQRSTSSQTYSCEKCMLQHFLWTDF